MVNLNAGLINGDDSAYARAEHSLWNALAFNQWITGSFGSREITSVGYGLRHMEECVWCCLHEGGLALAEYARHAVTVRQNTIDVNLLLPGFYRLNLHGRPDAEVRILSSYPAAADTVVEARHVPADMKVQLRVPSCVKRPEVIENMAADTVSVRLRGSLGHHAEWCVRGKMLFYGPLLLAPVGHNWSGPVMSSHERGYVPSGYIPEDLPRGLSELQVGHADADGFLRLTDEPLPDWTFFDEGPGAKCAVQGAAARVSLKFAGGRVHSLRFVPQCYFTSCLALYETPIVFAGSGEQ